MTAHDQSPTQTSRAAECAPAARTQPVAISCGNGHVLSGLFAEPTSGPTRGTVLALHGAGMCSRYFNADGGERSFLHTATSAGLRVLALDRPGYGQSAATFPDGLCINHQARCIASALRHSDIDLGGLAVVGHSFGSKVALAIAADATVAVQHVEIAGLGYRYAADPTTIGRRGSRAVTQLHWGPVRCYPPGTFVAARSHGIVQNTPPAEIAAAVAWPSILDRLAAQVPCTVHASFAQYERWWHATPADVDAMAALFPPGSFTSSLIPEAGHNSSLGNTAPQYHRDVSSRILSKCTGQESFEGAN